MFTQLWLAMTSIESYEQLMAIQASSFHEMKKEDRARIQGQLKKHSDINFEDNQKEVSVKDLGLILGMKARG